jgi:hypothetical protein
MATEKLIFPTIHLNGTSADDLFKQYADAAGAIRAAIQALPVPHGRDYYVQGNDAYPRARSEHEARVAMLRTLEADIRSILDSIADQRDERAASRRIAREMTR